MPSAVATLIETQSLEVAVAADKALDVDSLEQAILAQFPVQTQLLRWAIVAKLEPASVDNQPIFYQIEATLGHIE